MTMTTCQECKNEISNTAKACPHCGGKVPKAKVWTWIFGTSAVLFLALMILGLIFSSTPKEKEKAQDRDAISMCWEQQGKKSLDPATARFAASMCETMEQNFRSKYGVNP